MRENIKDMLLNLSRFIKDIITKKELPQKMFMKI